MAGPAPTATSDGRHRVRSGRGAHSQPTTGAGPRPPSCSRHSGPAATSTRVATHPRPILPPSGPLSPDPCGGLAEAHTTSHIRVYFQATDPAVFPLPNDTASHSVGLLRRPAVQPAHSPPGAHGTPALGDSLPVFSVPKTRPYRSAALKFLTSNPDWTLHTTL